MKKVISIILAVVIAVSVAVVAYAATYRGDIDGDGSVSAVDARVVLQFAAGLRTPTAEEKKIADMDGNGEVEAVDARKVLQTAAELLEPEKIPSETEKPNVNIGPSGSDGQISWGDISQVK